MVSRLPPIRKEPLIHPVKAWVPPDEASEEDEEGIEEEDEEDSDEERYPLFRGVLVFLAIVTVAVAGLSFVQHWNVNVIYVLAALAAGGTLYAVTELMVPLERVRDVGEEHEDPEEPHRGHHKEGHGRQS